MTDIRDDERRQTEEQTKIVIIIKKGRGKRKGKKGARRKDPYMWYSTEKYPLHKHIVHTWVNTRKIPRGRGMHFSTQYIVRIVRMPEIWAASFIMI